MHQLPLLLNRTVTHSGRPLAKILLATALRERSLHRQGEPRVTDIINQLRQVQSLNRSRCLRVAE